MAGSREYFKYVGDDGVEYAILIDESNGEATCGGTQLCDALTSATTQFLPRNIKKRYINATLDSDPKVRRRFWVGAQGAITNILQGDEFKAVVYPVSGDSQGTQEAWTVNSYRGERTSFVSLTDTGLTEGDD